MEQKIKDEVLEQLELDILFGFEGAEELFESIREIFYEEEEDFDDEWLKGEIATKLTKHKEESLSWGRPTDFERLAKVFDQLSEEKIVCLHKAGYTRQDAEDDCYDLIQELESDGISIKGYCYYHTQDLERALKDGGLFLGYDCNEAEDEQAIEIAQRIIKLLSDQDFKTEWNGSIDTRILIKDIQWKKSYDGIDYNYGRVFSILKKKETKKSANKKPFWKFW